MAYRHGVFVSEVETSVLPTVNVSAALPVVVGIAPTHMVENPEAAFNTPVLCHSLAEFVAAFGFVGAPEGFGFSYGLCEFADAFFGKYGASPAVFINVGGDPDRTTAGTAEITVEDGRAEIPVSEGGASAIRSSIVVKNEAGDTTYDLGVDYEVRYNKLGVAEIQIVDGGGITEGDKLKVEFDKFDHSAGPHDIIGGVDPNTGKSTGLELVNEVFARFPGMVPGQIVSPMYSGLPAVASVMATKAETVSDGMFKCMALIDIPAIPYGDSDPTDPMPSKYSDVPAWKIKNGITSPYQIAGWPCVKQGSAIYSFSSHAAGVIALTDAANEDVPYRSPSNQEMKITGSCLIDGTEVFLNRSQAQYLNGQGIVTALNMDGWKFFGNRTAVYPGVTDPKESFIPIRRMFNWVGNTFVRTYAQRLDFPLNPRQIQTITDSVNLWLNGLVARGFLIGGRVEFLESENPITDLMDGILRLHVYLTPPAPNREIDFILEFDPSYIAGMFAA